MEGLRINDFLIYILINPYVIRTDNSDQKKKQDTLCPARIYLHNLFYRLNLIPCAGGNSVLQSIVVVCLCMRAF